MDLCTQQGKEKVESSTDTYILSWVKQIASGKLLNNTGIPDWPSVTTGVGWEREGKLRDRGPSIYNYGWFVLLYDRNQHNVVKQLSFNKKNTN